MWEVKDAHKIKLRVIKQNMQINHMLHTRKINQLPKLCTYTFPCKIHYNFLTGRNQTKVEKNKSV